MNLTLADNNSYARLEALLSTLLFFLFSLVRPTISNSDSHPTEIIVIRGKSISLECEVQGIPQPKVTWMKDGRPLTKGRGMEILDEGHILQLKNIHVSDTGRYTCVAVNVAGMADRKYDLSVHSKYKEA